MQRPRRSFDLSCRFKELAAQYAATCVDALKPSTTWPGGNSSRSSLGFSYSKQEVSLSSTAR